MLKVTDDRSVSLLLLLIPYSLKLKARSEQCLKFKTRSAVFLNRFELFNRSILSQMQHRKPAPAPEPTEPAAATTDASPVAFASAEGAGVPLEPSTEPAKKKKKSKKKK